MPKPLARMDGTPLHSGHITDSTRQDDVLAKFTVANLRKEWKKWTEEL